MSKWLCENCHKEVRVVGGDEGTNHWHCDSCGTAVNAYQSPAPQPNNKKQTSDKWMAELHPTEKILDPDGWDRRNFTYSFYEEEITEQEFNHRFMMSTISFQSFKVELNNIPSGGNFNRKADDIPIAQPNNRRRDMKKAIVTTISQYEVKILSAKDWSRCMNG